MIPVLGSLTHPPPPPPSPRHAQVQICAHLSHIAAPKPSTVTRISSQTHPILVTVDTVHPGLCREGVESATVTRIAFLSGPLHVAVGPRKEHDDDDDDVDDDDDDEEAPWPE